MTFQLAATNTLSLELVVAIIIVSIVAGTVDVLRQPGWAWRRAEESKPAYCVLVLLVPLVGLGMYLRIRPKVKDLASAGRAASLPFESFGDDALQAQREDRRAVGTVIAPPERFGSFGATTVADGEIRLVGAVTGGAPDRGPSLLSAGGEPGRSATAERTRTYRPVQRASIPAPAVARAQDDTDSASTSTVPPGWKADPTGRHQFRYWAGTQWTENVADNGEQSQDAMTS